MAAKIFFIVLESDNKKRLVCDFTDKIYSEKHRMVFYIENQTLAKDFDQIVAVFNNPNTILFGLFVLFSIIVHTRMMENPKKGFWLELIRLILLGTLVMSVYRQTEMGSTVSVIAAAVSIAMILWLLRLNKHKERMSYQA